jgi:hypothetical protein
MPGAMQTTGYPGKIKRNAGMKCYGDLKHYKGGVCNGTGSLREQINHIDDELITLIGPADENCR